MSLDPSMKWSIPALVFTLVVSALGTARAQDEQPAEVVEARAAYNRGAAEYERGRYAEAHRYFQQAYEISNLTPILFNVSTSLDRLFRFADAIASYRAYLEHSDAEQAEYVRARIHRLEERLRAPNQGSREPEALAALQPLPASLAAPPPSQLPPILLMAGGGAVILASIVPGIAALSVRSDLNERCVNGQCTEADRGDLDKMDRLALTSDLLL
ncbi:MAG: tetratricopeptide (TPR) repeat protein, partial [Polyangiales bacterium]